MVGILALARAIAPPFENDHFKSGLQTVRTLDGWISDPHQEAASLMIFEKNDDLLTTSVVILQLRVGVNVP